VGYIGVMQGRLVPPEADRIQCFPRQRWADEFRLGAKAGVDSIEWIYDVWGSDANPISSDAGIQEVRELSKQHEVAVLSVCADYFMDRPLIRTDSEEQRSRVRLLLWLMSRCEQLGINRIVLPFVDQSAIRSQAEMNEVIAILKEVLPSALSRGLEIHLETSLAPHEFASLLGRLPVSNLRVNYDTGNSASLGYDFREEFSAYGDRIGSVHIKDRLLGGGSVSLGQGNADIPGVLSALQQRGYCGDLILQVARGESGREVEWVQRNRDIVLSHIRRMPTERVGGAAQ